MEWLEVSKELPPLDDMVWLYDPERGPWIGARADDGTCWLWANSYGRIWWNGVKWDGDKETDDDYKPTHWLRLPTPPNVSS